MLSVNCRGAVTNAEVNTPNSGLLERTDAILSKCMLCKAEAQVLGEKLFGLSLTVPPSGNTGLNSLDDGLDRLNQNLHELLAVLLDVNNRV